MAGKAIMEIYHSADFQVVVKEDQSPLTRADKSANEIINSILVSTGIPVISEENEQVPYNKRKDWQSCWIVDPLDGTKEFIRRNGEFTVNIALVNKGEPALGVIFAPALDILYYAIVQEQRAFKLEKASESFGSLIKDSSEIKPVSWDKAIKVVGSRSHMNEATLEFINDLKQKHQCEVELISKGSSLKFCLVAEGEAHFYPRFAPTMEWDTAAGQAICKAVGLNCSIKGDVKTMVYNRENLLNPHFLVTHGQ